MLSAVPAPSGATLHCLVVEAEPAPNALLRLLEPFVIHDVLPLRTESRADGERLRLAVTFQAAPDLAERLKMRLSVLPVVRRAALEPLAGAEEGVGQGVSAAA
ncbi:hypothetical protein [Xanthobacter sediminis]